MVSRANPEVKKVSQGRYRHSSNVKALSRLLFFHKLQGLLSRYDIDGTGFVPKTDTVALLCDQQHFRTEGSADKLSICSIRDGLQHLRNCCTVLSVQVGIDLVEQIERSRITSLDGENQRKST